MVRSSPTRRGCKEFEMGQKLPLADKNFIRACYRIYRSPRKVGMTWPESSLNHINQADFY
jgi:hypothetical protein